MSNLDQHEMNEKLKFALSKLKGKDFRQLYDLADFLKREDIKFSTRDLSAFGYLLATQFGRYKGIFHVPGWLTDVFSTIAEDISPNRICDPWAGCGFLIGNLQETCKAETTIAFTDDTSEMALGKVLAPKTRWDCGDPLSLIAGTNIQLDLVASILPIGLRYQRSLNLTLSSGKAVKLEDYFGNLLLIASSMCLTSSGIGLYVVTPSFFFSDRSVFHRLSVLEISLEAALSLPPGTFAPYTNIPTYLVVVRRKTTKQMFVAQLSADSNTNTQVISNFREGREGGSFELGKFVAPEDFRGIEHLRWMRVLEQAEKRFVTPAVNLSELNSRINLGCSGDTLLFQPLENTIYIPLIGNSDVVESPDALILSPQDYAQVIIDPTRSHARFVARFLNSEFGKQLREQSRTGYKLNEHTLKEIRVFVPDLEMQKKMLDIEARIGTERNTVLTFQNELSELSRELWANPGIAPLVEHRLSDLTKRLEGGIKQHAAESLDQWIETLPFPLASILRSWQATASQDFKTKYEHLLHFFEGTAEFIGVILLSAFTANEGIFEPHKKILAEAMQRQNLSFHRTTFGTWKLVVEYFGKQTRELLSENGKSPDDAKNDKELCADMFSDPSLSLPQALASKDLVNILAATNKMRNDWGGHGGVVGQEEAEVRNGQLLGEVQKLREAIAGTWVETQLIHAVHSRLHGGIYENEISILMSSNSEFLKESRAMSMCLDVERLYLAKKDSGRALKLLPLVQVGPSPQSAKNACYFFNRIEKDGARFISYHYLDKPELTGQFADADEAIRFLTQVVE